MAKEKNENNGNKILSKKNIIGLIIAFIMVSSVLGIYSGSSSNTSQLEDYNGYSFVYKGNYVSTKVNGRELKFYNHPAFVENIAVDESIISRLKSSKMIYLTFSPDIKFIQQVELMRLDMTQQFQDGFNTFISTGVAQNSTLYSKYQIINCESGSSYIPVLYVKEGNETKAEMTGNCIYIQAEDGNSLLQLKDKITYRMLNIIK